MTAKGSRDCLDGLDRNDNALVATGMKEMHQATAAADSITASRAGRP
ncbi:hypothetical protein ABZ667_30805 [Streptomyces lavendulae]